MADAEWLPADRLRWYCPPGQFRFQTTDELPDLEQVVGQQRAIRAIEFGVGMRRDGYNLYLLGPPGMGKQSIVTQYLRRRAGREPTPSDWCYVNNFELPEKPIALRLPSGRGKQLKQDVAGLVEDLRAAIPSALQSEEHRNRVEELQQEYKERHEQALSKLSEKAKQFGLEVIRTPAGVALAPVRDGEVISPEQFEKLTEEEKQEVQKAVENLQPDLQAIVQQVPQLQKEAHQKVKQLNREATRFATSHLMAQLKKQYEDQAEVLQYLDAVERDVVEHSRDFLPSEEETPAVLGVPGSARPSFHRYEVNLLVDHSETQGAPIVYEEYPTYHNLVGRVEHQTQLGSLVTEFTLIKPGALHRANGGYLMLEARQVLSHPHAWEGLKRALRSRNVRIESLGAALSLISAVSLEPQEIPLDVKVIVFGERRLYYLLHQLDPDFAELFKAAADFDEHIDRSEDQCRIYAQFLATLARREGTRPLDPSAVARIMEHSVRVSEDRDKLSMHMRTFADLIREADYWTDRDGAQVISARHIQQTIDQQTYRADRVRQQVQEQMVRGTILIDTEGEQVGQVNGLSVLDLGNFRFGRPSRITATTRLGKGEVVDIEREVELGGAIHSKGVLILSSFLAAHYAKDRPLSLSASLVFEQSYGMVDGDSASIAELCALLSGLANAPIRQSLAVTGSVNQHGQAQAIGGVNEKIEGFFDLCRTRGLTGDQGVLIPAANVRHLMLREDVVEAVSAGQFHVYGVSTIDQAVSLLTGVPAGEPDEDGRFPDGSINQRVQARLMELSRLQQQYAAERKADRNHDQ